MIFTFGLLTHLVLLDVCKLKKKLFMSQKFTNFILLQVYCTT